MKKKKLFLRRMRARLLIIMMIASLVLVGLIVRIIYINRNDGSEYEQVVLSQKNYDSLVVPYKRGDITDRNGTVLATSNKVYNLVIEPKNILKDDEKKEATINAITTYFDITAEELSPYLEDSNSLYKVVLRRISYEEVQAFNEYCDSSEGRDVVGVWFEDNYVRVYPNGELACHVLGFTVSGNEGLGGLEGTYNDYLNGEDGRIYTYLTDDYNFQKTVEPATNGYNLVTTIDAEIQTIVQENAEEYLETTGAKNISVLVMDPQSCEVLAIYNANQYDPNNAYSTDSLKYLYTELTDEEFAATVEAMTDEERVEKLNKIWRSFVVSDSFEPGSTYKVFTIAGAIEEGVLTGNETFYCDGGQQVADYWINCVKREGHGDLTVAQALEKSCNDAFMQIAAMEGPSVFDKYQVLFGFGQRTNIDLTGEASESSLSSLVYHEETLNPVELATSSFGQGVTVTMMQLGTAFCSVINGGYYYEPHVVSQIIDEDGNVIENYEKILVRRTISEETSDKMRELLFQVVEEGSGKKAGVEGYTIGGKTGTAEKWPRNEGNYVLSFIGFAPVENPQVVVYCVVDEPNVENQAVSGAGSILFNMIAEDLLPYMNIYRTNDNFDLDTSDADVETPTPVYDGNTPENDVAGMTGGDVQNTDGGTDDTQNAGDGSTDGGTDGTQNAGDDSADGGTDGTQNTDGNADGTQNTDDTNLQ